MKKFFFFLLLFFLANASFGQIDYKGFPQWSWHKQDSTEYYLYTPSKAARDSLYPIVLFLHGCCGESYHATLRNTVDPPVRMWHNFGANTQKVPTYIIAPATSRGWSQHIPNLKKVMDDLIAHHRGDPRRVYITGFSMGGSGTWEFLQQYPNYFAAALPMGMNFHGDHQKIKNIPIWTNRGETDYWARDLHKDVWAIRKLHGNDVDSNQSWVTGVNPRFTSFPGVGHNVQWIAASTQDLTGWAYEKVADGNAYPVVFFRAPSYKQLVKKGAAVPLHIQAADEDGSIRKVMVKLNGTLYATLTKAPYTIRIKAPGGDTRIEAVAVDDKGKESTATTWIKTDIKTELRTAALPYARQGALYEKQLFASGNGAVAFSAVNNNSWPAGLELSSSGLLSGVPVATGQYFLDIQAKDEDGDTATARYTLDVKKKLDAEIIVTNALNDSGVHFPVSKIRTGAFTHFNRADDEISISNAAGYEGMTYVLGNKPDTNRSNPDYLSFEVDEDATVIVAYERKDHLFTSGIPAWLQDFQRVPSRQLVAQYFYYDLYAKDFPKGKVTLPGADEGRHNASNNYFVLVQKAKTPYQFRPEVNTISLASGAVGQLYREQLTGLHGAGLLTWDVVKGRLPQGVGLSSSGMLQGRPAAPGRYPFTVRARDEKGQEAVRELELVVKSVALS